MRNVANYSPPLFSSTVPDEWRTLVRLAGVVTGQGPDCDVDALDDAIAEQYDEARHRQGNRPSPGRPYVLLDRHAPPAAARGKAVRPAYRAASSSSSSIRSSWLYLATAR